MKLNKFSTTFVIFLLLLSGGFAKNAPIETVLLPVSDDPTVSFRILFNVGSMHDPAGKEGLAALTASMLTQGSTQAHSYEQVLELLYPMAASISDV